MNTLLRMHRRGLLTEEQLRTAEKFGKAPAAYALPDSLREVLMDVVVRDEGLEYLEKKRGWPCRSGKVAVELALDALHRSRKAPAGETGEAASDREMVAFMAADDIEGLIPAMQKYGLTALEARLFLLLLRAGPSGATKETLLRRMYHNRADDPPGETSLNVYVCRLRKRLEAEGAPYRIDTHFGVGYRMVETQLDKAV